MAKSKKPTPVKAAKAPAVGPSSADARGALAQLERHATRKTADGMARYGIDTKLRVLGVSVSSMHTLAKRLKKELDSGARHALAAALWESGVYEGQMLAAFVDDPALVTRTQMNAWAGGRHGFDNWGICDTACFHLFDRSPHAWEKASQWANSPKEFVKRAAFALMASLVVHDKSAPDAEFLRFLPLIERGAHDDRNFVKKGVNWALRCIGKRSLALNKAAVATARRLAASEDPAPRWVGKDALRELTSPKLLARLSRRVR